MESWPTFGSPADFMSALRAEYILSENLDPRIKDRNLDFALQTTPASRMHDLLFELLPGDKVKFWKMEFAVTQR